MQRNLIFSAILAVALGLLAGCADSLQPDNPNGGKVDHNQVRYLKVAIVSPSSAGTRTTNSDFLTGDDEESFVEKMTFVFYDANGLPTGTAHDMTFTTNGAADGFTSGLSGSVGKIWNSTIPVVLSQGENLPAYVMCFVNPIAVEQIKTTSMSGIEEIKRQEVVKSQEVDNSKRCFPMSNSVYYGTSPQGQTNVRLYATPISTDQLYPTAEAADRDVNTVDIYVERYAARIELKLAVTGAIADNTADVNGYTLTFVPEFWRPNAIDQDIYVIKRFGLIEGGVANYDPTYSALLTNFNNKTWWNEAEKFRSYWACSPSYYTNKYPKVSDDITDVVPNNDYPADRSGYPYDLHYFNYTQIKNSAVTNGGVLQKSIAWDAANGFNKVFYARETTTSSGAWGWGQAEDIKGYNPAATLPSAVIVGHYNIVATGTGVTAVPDAPTGASAPNFYLYGRTNNKYNLYFDSNIKKAMVDQQNVVLAKNGTSYVAYRGEAGFVVEHPSKDVRDIKSTVVAGRHVALQLDKNALPELYYYAVPKDSGSRQDGRAHLCRASRRPLPDKAGICL